MANFDVYYPKLMKSEGGYVFDKDDLGGETYKGISRKYNPNWIGWKKIDEYKKKYPNDFKIKIENDKELNDSCKRLYKECYWDIFDADDFNSQRVAEIIVDTCVNCGQSAAIRMAYRVLGLKESSKWTLELHNKLVAIKD